MKKLLNVIFVLIGLATIIPVHADMRETVRWIKDRIQTNIRNSVFKPVKRMGKKTYTSFNELDTKTKIVVSLAVLAGARMCFGRKAYLMGLAAAAGYGYRKNQPAGDKQPNVPSVATPPGNGPIAQPAVVPVVGLSKEAVIAGVAAYQNGSSVQAVTHDPQAASGVGDLSNDELMHGILSYKG